MIKSNTFCFKFKSSKTYKALTALFFLVLVQQANAQIVEHNRFSNDYKWKVTLQTNFLDTNLSSDKPVNTENWSMLPYPSKITVERNLLENLSFEAGFAMNKIEKDKKVGGRTTNDELNTFAIDGAFKYSIGGLLKIPYVEPYLGVGMGYSEINSEGFATFNFGGGLNFWLVDTGLFRNYVYTREHIANRIGLTVEAYAKKNIDKTEMGNQGQFSAGLFFVF